MHRTQWLISTQAKTPSGGFGGGQLSPLHAHYRAQLSRLPAPPGAAGALPDDAGLSLDLGDAAPFSSPAPAVGPAAEYRSPNGQEYHAAWGLPAPKGHLPQKVSVMLRSSSMESV